MVAAVAPAAPLDRAASPALVPPRLLFGALGLLGVVPVRGYLTDVGWSESGGRFAWRVMATNKVGLAELYVQPTDGRHGFTVEPNAYSRRCRFSR